MTPGTWLVDQLPVCMASDPLLRSFVTIFQVLADDLVDRIDGVEHVVDPSVAPAAFRHWLTGWLAVPGIDASAPSDLQRDLLVATGGSLRRRGTSAGLRELLLAVTGDPVQIEDGGRVLRGGDRADGVVGTSVRVEVPSTGAMSERDLVALVRREMPAHVGLHLFVAGRRVFPALLRARPAR